MNGLMIAPDLIIPLAVITEKLAILAQSGAGKSYLAMRLAELMIQAGAQVVALDPVGTWWGLRVTASGDPSGLPIVVFGGEHGDLPLDPAAGAAIADVIVDLGISAVLDLSDLEMPEQKRFTAAFAERFFHRKKRAKSPVHLFLEEAQVFAPQFPERDETTMLNRVERLCRIGRNYGVGWTIVSQRPQEVHKKVLNQAGTLFALRTVGRHERKAIADWVVDKATASDVAMLEALPSLPTGTAHVWSPAFLRVATTIRVSRRETFDSSRTPEIGESATATVLAPLDVDLNAIKALLEAASVQAPDKAAGGAGAAASTRDQTRAVAEQRKLLDERDAYIATLEGELRDLRARPAFDTDRFAHDVAAMESAAMRVIDAAGELKAEMARSRPAPKLEHEVMFSEASKQTRSVKQSGAPNRQPAQNRRSAPVVVTPTVLLTTLQQRILDTLASLQESGLYEAPRGNVAVLADGSPKSSSFHIALRQLSDDGLIVYPSAGIVAITNAGLDLADGSRVIGLGDIHTGWQSRVTLLQWRLLSILMQAYPAARPRRRLAELVGERPGSSAYAASMADLKSLGLVDYPSSDQVVVTALLFPEGLKP